MRICLDCPVEDLAFRFGVSVSLATSIITTFIVVLSLELTPLIYWPTPDETISYKHFHFNWTFDKCEGIGDCTEQWIEHSKNPDAQYQKYSSYKSNNTLKKLIFCSLDQFRIFGKHMQVHVQIVSLPKIQIFLLNLRLVLWYYLIKASTFKICFCHVK